MRSGTSKGSGISIAEVLLPLPFRGCRFFQDWSSLWKKRHCKD